MLASSVKFFLNFQRHASELRTSKLHLLWCRRNANGETDTQKVIWKWVAIADKAEFFQKVLQDLTVLETELQG
jgi:hypothetical protein